MAKKFCKKCGKEIEEGKEIKIKKTLKTGSHSSYRGKYSGWSSHHWPIETASYYLCDNCFEKYEQELAKEKGGGYVWAWILGGGCYCCNNLFALGLLMDY
ncbi:protein of unknown function [endosymbiont DhMRE of Dentiscutata heterogama]|uniref:hypothetical protein n=1 Tax=endosymbiont DhMRE of Dentiscutata heterogama TaxID=1609546 RepID=UPI000629D30A|nr:hypothetical protein [endosymbiont DhMRE of Dentiscutata heterogama]CFW93377.1 protein of unknown function [endosymbiont DhMRE of Dentiscutata heterogama]